MKSKIDVFKVNSLLMLRRISIAFLILRGICTLLYKFPFVSGVAKKYEIQKWAKSLLRVLNVNIRVQGIVHLPLTPFLLVSNHISWLDIHVLNAHKPISFVAKSEVSNWPIFGWMAQQLGTLFIRRGDSRHARLVVGEMVNMLSNNSVCIFPEGTSTAGDRVLLFKPNLFEAAIQAKVPVYPLAIEYFCKEMGERSYAPAFIGDMGLLESIDNVLKSQGLMVTLTFFPPIESSNASPKDRKWLSQHCFDCISTKISHSMRS